MARSAQLDPTLQIRGHSVQLGKPRLPCCLLLCFVQPLVRGESESPPPLPCARSGFWDRIQLNRLAKCTCHASAWIETHRYFLEAARHGRKGRFVGVALALFVSPLVHIGLTQSLKTLRVSLCVPHGVLLETFERLTTPWRNGSASDSSPEGCAFKSRRGHFFHFALSLSNPRCG